MLLSTLLGCQATSTDQQEGQTTKPQNPNPVTITLMTLESDTEWKVAETPNFKAIQKILLEKFNVDYQLETALSKEYETTISTRFASGKDLPDIVNYAYSASKMIDLYKNGLILKLNDLIDQNAPDFKTLLGTRPYLTVANGDREGNILRIPASYVENPQHLFSVMTIRKDWLKKVNLEMPKTPDGFFNALKSFQDQDVNGNGKKDEILTAIGISKLNKVLGAAFGVKYMENAANSWYVDKAGKIYNTALTNDAKNYVTFMNQLYAAKLLDNDFLNQTSEQYNGKLYNNLVASEVGAWWDSVLLNTQVRDKGFADAELIPMVPSLSVNGQPMIYIKDLPGYGGFMITKDCNDPAAAMKVINWGYTLEGSQMNYYGETGKGGNYYEKATALDGLTLPEYQMQYTAKGKAAAAEEPLLWNKMGWVWELSTKCLIGNADSVAQEFSQSFGNAGTAADIQFNLNGLNDAVKKYGIPAVNFVAPSTEQSAQWKGYNDLWTYMDEMISKFVTGVEPMTNWDSFIAKCASMGINDATAIKQNQYDTYQRIMSAKK